MTKILNLDDVAPAQIDYVVKIRGVPHAMMPLTVDQFIAVNQTTKLVSEGNASELTYVESIKNMLAISFPTMADKLGGMTFAKLNAIMEFVNDVGEVASGAPEGEASGEAKAAK